MSSRPIVSPFPVITNGNMAGSLVSIVTVIQNISQLSYDISWSGGISPVGTAEVQVSNTYSQNADGSVRNAGSWTTILTGPVTGNSGTGFMDIDAIGAYAIRLIYTRVSGTGTMNATINGKVA